jgi:hypothetical protein
LLILAVPLVALTAGPVEFGRLEFDKAMRERGLAPTAVRFRTLVSNDPPGSFSIQSGIISGGDLRGLMYGLLEAADQIRVQGRLSPMKAKPATPIRGIRYFLHNAGLERDWYYSREYWTAYFQMLARNRFNRFNLVFAHQTPYLAPPYPFWIALDEFPQIRARGLTDEQRARNLDMLRFISQTASDYGIDFTLGVWEHNIQPGMKPSVEGLTPENIGPYSYAALKAILSACPAIRSVQMRTNSESGIPADRQLSFYRDYVFKAIREAGRLVHLDVRGWLMNPDLRQAVTAAGVPARFSAKYWSEDMGRPYQPAETYANYSYMDFLRRPRDYDFYWEIWGLGSHRLLLWGDPEHVRRAVPTFALSGTIGFEIDPPLAQKGFGNAPGHWGVFTAVQKNRIFWKWEFERYWAFYMLWGRLSYDPKTPEKVWLGEFTRRFGAAGADVLAAYTSASKVINEIVAAHLADPNMYIWPEINPGGLIESYREVLPSDQRYIASIPEAVRNRLKGEASAKQTPQQTAEFLNGLAYRTEQALARAREKINNSLPEWRSTESDMQVLAALARYHANKQLAADQLTEFYETGREQCLQSAKSRLRSALTQWTRIVKLTDGVYPSDMAFGPDDTGHWRDKLPWVEHDLKLVEERERIFKQFGRFDFGFDFGAAVVKPGRGSSYRTTPYVWSNSVEPRFTAVAIDTIFDGKKGYGWVSDGARQAVPLPLADYYDVRAARRVPKRLPDNTLYGDAIRGVGAQQFRVRAPEGEYLVWTLSPDGTAAQQRLRTSAGILTITFPEGGWESSGLVISNVRTPQAPSPKVAQPLSRPRIEHVPPSGFTPGRPLALSLRVYPVGDVVGVRLHFRALNHLVPFQTIENPASKLSFTVPAAGLPADADLLYYFEILKRAGGGWFQPDPQVATPYYVLKMQGP